MKIIRILIAMCLMGVMLLLHETPLLADTNDVFLQTDWIGGSSALNAVHPTNKTGWDKFSSKDAYLNVGTAGRVTELVQVIPVTDTTDADFALGTRTKLDITGTGAAASLGLQSGNEDPFLTDLGQWTTHPELPALVQWSAYLRAGNYIYALWRTTTFARFNMTTENWEFLADITMPTGHGAALVYPGGDFIYATQGGGTTGFYKYSISGNVWTKLAPVSYGVGVGGSLASNNADKIFCLAGGGTNKFYLYTISTNTWSTLPVATRTVTRGASLVYPGMGSDLYALFDTTASTFSRYSIAGNQWVPLTAAPVASGDLCYPGTGDYLYAWYEETWGSNFVRYNYKTSAWENLSATSQFPIYQYKGIFYDPGVDGKLRWLSNGNYARPLTFDPSTKLWSNGLIGVKSNSVSNWGRMLYDGTDTIYHTTGGTSAGFVAYSISTNLWTSKASMPWGVYYGHDMTWLNGKVYAIQGYSNTGFASYVPGTTWTSLAATPATINYGGTIATDGTYIYCLRGTGTATFWRYELGVGWRAAADAVVTDAPATITGGSLVYPYAPGGGDFLFTPRGQNTKTFYKYEISTKTWTQAADAPYMFSSNDKNTLTYPGTGNYIYAFFGSVTGYGFARYDFINNAWEILAPTNLWQDSVLDAVSVGDKIYVTNSVDMFTYTISTNTWDYPRNYNVHSFTYGSAINPEIETDSVYMFYGNGGSVFWKYSLSQKKWTALLKAPFLFLAGTKAAYPGTGNFIYVIQGGLTKYFWKYDFVNNEWTQLADTNYPVFSGSRLTGKGEALYLAPGRDVTNASSQNSFYFLKYTISTNIWERVADLPYAIQNSVELGNSMIMIESQGKIYWRPASGSGGFYMYNTGANAWTTLTAMPIGGYNGQALCYPGFGDYIYNPNEVTTGVMYRYSISMNSWSEVSRLSRGNGYYNNDADMFYPGSGDFLYFFDGTVGYFTRYSLANNTWDQPPTYPTSTVMQYYAVFERGIDGNTLYSGGYGNFYKYNITTRAWSGVRAPVSDLGWNWDEWAPQLHYPGTGDYLYTTQGRNRVNFARYSVSQNKWFALTAPSFNFGSGHKLAGTASKIYLLVGNSSKQFWAYNIVSNQWAQLADLAGTVNYGSSLCYPGSGDLIYATRGDLSNDFYKYSITTNTWTPLASAPVMLYASDVNGASLTYPGRGDYLYFLPASTFAYSSAFAGFYRYSISQNTWEEISPAPAGIWGVFSKVVYPGQGDYLYVPRGGYSNTWDILQYRLFKQGQYVSPIKTIGLNQTYDTATWSDNAKGLLEFKVRTSNNAQLSDAVAWDNVPSRQKGDSIADSYPAVKPNDQYLQYQMNFFAEDLTKLPILDELTINYDKYPRQQVLISSAFNSTEAKNRLMKLSWNNTLPAGTSARFLLRTAADNGGEPGNWSPWLGPGGTQTINHTFSSDSDYVHGPSIEVINDLGRLKAMLEDYTYTQRITLDNTSGVNSYTDVVVTITISSENVHFWEHVKADGSDVRFVDGTSNLLSYNLNGSGASFDAVNKAALIYVKVPSVGAGQKVTIYLKYGNAAAVSASDSGLIPFIRFGAGGVIDSNTFNYSALASLESQDKIVKLTGLATGWGTKYLSYKPTYLRSDAKTFFFRFMQDGSSNTMIGWRLNTTDYSYPQLTHCIYFAGTTGYIYEAGSNPATAGTFNLNTWYDGKIVLKPAGGATYYWRPTGQTAWTLLYDSTNRTETNLRPSIDHYTITPYAYTKDWVVQDQNYTYPTSSSSGGALTTYFSSVEEDTTSASLSGWRYRNPVEINNTTGGELTNYQAKVILTSGFEGFWSYCRSDGADVRFVDADNATILNHYTASFDYANKTATLWVKVPKILAGETRRIYLYYGRSDAADVSNMNTTLVKDFDEKGTENISGLSVNGLGAKATVASSSVLDLTEKVTVEANLKYGIDYWPSGWTYRKQVTFNNIGSTEKKDVLLQFDVPMIVGMKADYADLRFWETDHSQKLRYNIKSYDGTKATVNVIVPYIAANSMKNIYMYYDNAAASSEGEAGLGAAIFYDEFDSDLSKWGAKSGASITNVDGRTTVTVTGGYAQTTALLPFQSGHTYTIEYAVKGSAGQAFVGLSEVAARSSAELGSSGYLLGIDNLIWSNSYFYNELGNGANQFESQRVTYSTSSWYVNKFNWTPATSVTYTIKDGTDVQTQPSYVPAHNAAIYPTIRAASGSVYLDYIKIYEGTFYNSFTMTPTFSAAQTQPAVVAWLPGFSYRKKITITNSSSTAIVNSLYSWNVAFVTGNMKADYTDIRFVDTDGKKLSYKIFASDASQANFLVRIPLIPANATKDIFMYYGNANALSEQDALIIDATPSTGLAAWWKFDEASGTSVVDSSGNGRNATLQTTAFFTAGKKNNCVAFNNGWVSVPAIALGTTQGTMAAWVKITSATTQYLVNGVGGFWMSEYGVAGRVGFDVNRGGAWVDGGGGMSTGLYIDSVPFNTWTHLAVTFNSGVVKLYKDGVLVITKSYTSGVLNDMTASGGGGLGRWSSGGFGPGSLDEVVIYNRALTDQEIQGLAALNLIITPTFGTEEAAPAGIDQAVVMKSGAYGLKFTDAGLTAMLNGTSLSTTSYDSGTFMHAAMTYDGALLKLFVNGAQKASSAVTGVITTNSNALTIGDSMNGVVDEIRIWNVARFYGDINADQLKYLDGTSTGLVSYLRFNDATSSVAVDSSIYGNNATLANGADWALAPFSYSNNKARAVYHIDEGVGLGLADATGNNNTLTGVNTSWSNTDLTGFSTGKSLNFNGTTAYASAPASSTLDVTGKISLEAWIKPLTTVGSHVILAKGNDASLRWNYKLVQIADSVAFVFSNAGTQQHLVTPACILTDSIYYIAATFDEPTSTVKIYVNGVLKYTSILETSRMAVNTDPLYVGREASGANAFLGGIDEVRIYNRVLTQAEITAHYEQRQSAAIAPVTYNVYEPVASVDVGAYAIDNPVIQPLRGFYYAAKNMIQFQELSNKPYGTDIRYQVSPNAYAWYWWDGTQWSAISGGYSQTNTATEINAHLAALQDFFPDGVFYYRAYLHSEPFAFKTPSLDNIGVTFQTGETFYVLKDGATPINPIHSDADSDQWYQYKALLYSDGMDTGILDDVSVDYIKSYLTVTAPNGGEVFAVGDTVSITWVSQAIQTTGGSGLVKIEYSVDGGNTYQTIATHLANTGSYTWTIPDAPAQQALIKITSEDLPSVTDVSDAAFRLLSVNVTSPNGAEVWEAGKTHAVTWQVTGNVPNNIVKIEYSSNAGTTWTTVSAVAPNTGTFSWTVPSVFSDNMKIRVSSPTNDRIMDMSDAVFSIVRVPSFTISSPVANEQFSVGASALIAWRTNSLMFSDNVILEYSTDDFQNDVQSIATVPVGTPQGANKNDNILGTYSWTVPDLISSSVKVQIREEALPPGRDTQQQISIVSPAFEIIQPQIQLTAPATTDVWVVGDSNNITWTSQGTVSNDLKLEYSVNGTDYTLIADNQANTGSYVWVVPVEAVGAAVYVRITDNNRSQVSAVSSPFKVLAHATIEIIQPNGGETLTMGTDYEIKWRTYGNKLKSGGADYNKISIFYSVDNGTTWTLAVFDRANTGTYTWHVPDFPTTEALIKVLDQNDALAEGISAVNFSIVLPSITLTSPVGGESWYATGSYEITWTSIGSISNNIKIEYSTNSGSSWNVIKTGQANTGTYIWGPVADVNSTNARIRIIDLAHPTVMSVSPLDFTITPPTLSVISPNGGEAYAVGTTNNIRWTTTGDANGAIRDNITIQFSFNNGSSWTNVTTGETNDGLYEWTVSDNVSATCLIKIFDASRPATVDTSDAVFTVALPSVTVVSPNGSEEWPIGTQKVITWTSLGAVSNNLTLEYSKDNFSTATLIASGVANVDSYNWTVPDDLSAVVKIRITDADRTAITDTSDSAFSIVNPVITVKYPNGGELLSVGDLENITWEGLGTISNSLRIEYSKDSFSTVQLIAASAPNTGTYAWTLPEDQSATVKIRITDNGRPLVWDKSDQNFTILPTPVITVTAPVSLDVWRVGTEHEITWTDNGGRISNNLTLQYSTDGGTVWHLIATGIANMGTYLWTVPDAVCATAKVRVFDANRVATSDESEPFNLAIPKLTLVTPNGGEVWSVGDRGPVTWTHEGTVSDNIVLEYSPDNGGSWYLVRGGIPNSGSFSWTVPDYVTAQCLVRVKDGNRPEVLDVTDAVFTINPMPTITVTAPSGGEDYVLSNVVPITWTWTGLSISNITLDYSNDNFTTRRIIATNLPNTGTYNWTVPADALTGTQMKIRLTDGTRTQIVGQSSGYFRIRGGFVLLSPNGGEQWVSQSPQTIAWQTLGTIPNVKLEYTLDGANWVFIGAPANAGTYTWTLPNAQATAAKIRISDPDDSTTTDQSNANFSMVYSTVVFKVLDYDSLQHLQDFMVSEPVTGWSDSGQNSPITRTTAYPYGTYTTFFTKQDFIDSSVTWSPPKSGISAYYITVYMENSSNAQVAWDAILTYSFSPASDTLMAVGSLQRKGKLIGTTEIERADLGAATLKIFEPDGATVRNELVATTPANTGMYNFTLTDTNFEGGLVYPATLTIEYRGRPYVSVANIDVGSEILQYEFFTQTATNLAASVENIERTVNQTATEIKTEIKGAIESSHADLKAETTAIRTATETTLPAQLAETKAVIEVGQKSQILNTESSIRVGEKLVVRYRTYSGLNPIIDVYNATNVQQIAGAPMVEVGTTGIYEYSVTFYQAWGKGQFSIVCSEPTKGSMDAMTITVGTTDMEQVYNQVSSIVGSTATLPNVNNIITNMGAQFGLIETAINKMSTDVLSGVSDALGSTTSMKSLFTQISGVSKQLKNLSGDSGLNLESLYTVSEERQQDMVYLKNKTQELKAGMDLSRKLMENIANKPVTQTWYEYKK